ncbi:dihydrolipoyl dehydrogenase [Candidatus Venteria ishoeyi]|uniref:dihydrolipoyl dehydrogenase n=1 Tax=Candidatus Venteria ishoeyi TaxID=1899563 RepID=UPI0025A57E9B|nr:dihydrolipoyl dehydrogenase [Candidatus Venteria ishoeyi]MDM8547624.1 dihydrolipoyl dehydrogenase [Candidatus Venteria ishoeyi]
MEKKVDVAIIGAGTAGLTAMGYVRRYTDNFVLINGGELGTTCARVGCMPSKAVIQISEHFHLRHLFDRHAINGSEKLHLDQVEGMEHVRDMRDTFVDRVVGNSTDNLDDEHLIEAYAQFLEPTLLAVGDLRIRADKVIIATGSRPIVPEAWQDFREQVLTTDEFFEQTDFPDKMAVLGLGVIGLEIGQSLHRMGVNVVGVDLAESIGGVNDPVASKVIAEVIGKEFPLWLGQAASVTQEGEQLRVTAGENSMLVDKVLASLGRVPNIDTLGLENLNIQRNVQGIPDYNLHTGQIADLPIFIAGDVTGHRPILHEAGHEARIAAYNAMHENVTAFRRKTPLSITFCDPNIASVGTPLAELDEERVAIGEMRMGPVGRALIMGKNKGIIRVYGNQVNGKILGASLCCVHGENLAHLLAWAIEQELTVFDLLAMPFYHPVIEEALQAALYDLMSKVEHKPDYPVELTPVV